MEGDYEESGWRAAGEDGWRVIVRNQDGGQWVRMDGFAARKSEKKPQKEKKKGKRISHITRKCMQTFAYAY